MPALISDTGMVTTFPGGGAAGKASGLVWHRARQELRTSTTRATKRALTTFFILRVGPPDGLWSVAKVDGKSQPTGTYNPSKVQKVACSTESKCGRGASILA